MPLSGGTFTITYDFTDDQANSINPQASRFDQNFTDIINALNTAWYRDGQVAATANIPMGSFKFTNIGDGSALTDSVSFKQLQNSAGQYALDTGAADAYAIAPSPTVTAYATGQTFRFKATNTNTGASTLAVSGLTAKTIKKSGGSALSAGDIADDNIHEVTYDGTDFILQNPAAISASDSFILSAQIFS